MSGQLAAELHDPGGDLVWLHESQYTPWVFDRLMRFSRAAMLASMSFTVAMSLSTRALRAGVCWGRGGFGGFGGVARGFPSFGAAG